MKAVLLALAVVAATASTSSMAEARPRWPGRPGPGPARGVVCVAQNLRGQRFEAVGRNRNQASRLAMRQCESVSARCRVIACSFR